MTRTHCLFLEFRADPERKLLGRSSPAGGNYQGGQQLGAPRAGGGGLGLSTPPGGKLDHRAPAKWIAQGGDRHRLEGAAAAVRAVSSAQRARHQPQQDRGGDRARTLGLCLGNQPAGQAQLSHPRAAPSRPVVSPITRRSFTHIQSSNSIGEVARSRLENPRRSLWIAIAATPQSLERGSSMTNNSLAANQRPHISLIDRRHRWARRLAYRVRSSPQCSRRQQLFRPLDNESHINETS
jgi:hypothetical protein